MRLHYTNLLDSAVNITGSTSVLSIDSCVLSYGVDISDELSGGLAILLDLYNIHVSIRNVVSTRNVAKRGANFLFGIRDNIGSIKIINSTSSLANHLPPHVRDEALYGAGFALVHRLSDTPIQMPTTAKTLLYISDSKFYDNNGVGFHFQQMAFEGNDNVKYDVIICNSSFQNHVNPSGSGVITVFNLRRLIIFNSTFAINKQTALQAFDSTLYFEGQIIFSGNNGTLGGALMLQGGSKFYLMPNTHVQIVSNHAKRGGGIYVEDENARAIPYVCFFQVFDLHYPYFDSMITLENNTADEAGSAVYGGDIDNCATNEYGVNSSTLFTAVFKISDTPSNVSQISSNPFAVHVCNHWSDTGSETYIVQVYPGQTLKVPVALHGQRNGFVPGIVHANLEDKSRDAHLAPLQETQEIVHSCKNLTYTISSTGHHEVIRLRADRVHYYESKSHILINATLLPCPPGFQISNFTAQCECDPMLQERGLLCNISGGTPLV